MALLQRSTGLAMIGVPVICMAAFTGLQMSFNYPDVLREPAADILARFSAGGPGLLATWYIFMLSALAFIPVGVLSGGVADRDGHPRVAADGWLKFHGAGR